MYLHVKDAIEKIKKRLYEKLNDAFSDRPDYLPIVERKKPWVVRKSLLVTGKIYHFYKTRQERLRVFVYRVRDDFANVQILFEIAKHTGKLLFLMIIAFAISTSIYFFIYEKISFSLSPDGIKNLLLGYFAGVTALLGIIFAFYSVGFQIATSKFSSEVTDYINQEKVGKFFFNLLVLTGVFSLITAVAQYGVTFPLTIPFFVTTFLVIFSLLGILIFKDD